MRRWIQALTEQEETTGREEINEHLSAGCNCKLYTCYQCFPDNFVANQTFLPTEANKRFGIGDIVKISQEAGGCLAEVKDIKGTYLTVIRESDNTKIIIHHGDAQLHEAFHNEDIELDFDDDGISLSDPISEPEDWQGDDAVYRDAGDEEVDDLIQDILDFQDMGASGDRHHYTPEILQRLTIDAIRRIHNKVTGQEVQESPVEEENLEEIASDDFRIFDVYEKECERAYGRVVGRSKFLAMNPDERIARIEQIRSEAP